MVAKPSKAIVRSSSGPTFGDGYDLFIADDAKSNNHSQTNFGKYDGYSVPSGVQDKNTVLAGTLDFRPDEMEVFYRQYDLP